MKVKTGIDLLRSKRFLESFKIGGEAFSRRVFTSQELKQNTREQLASIFCLKEAIIKALKLPVDSWLMISTNRQSDGKVECSFTDLKLAKKIISLDTSISHDGGWIVAVVFAILHSE